ncbi:hypothetical protein C723_0585 [Christiangramia flava JLT2011]|uniref:Uncharacterized protein n=1 Tax=Christiangramia flava JLT2011 TaxID=1229726 RepID=A0A1L7I3J0_9FLAO|nr:hypothetical protein GRFL_1050 [Christiangramia flava JLT2011]OSS40277.1 hypothetical protein C723_0585 [Christiangramia flava JLT2011]
MLNPQDRKARSLINWDLNTRSTSAKCAKKLPLSLTNTGS